MAEDAAMRSCPRCGGPVASGDRECSFCFSPIATVRCARCYAMSSPDVLHCGGCGIELGLMPVGVGAASACPDCGVPLAGFGGGSGVLLDCARCGGQFVEHALLRELIERREVAGATVPRPVVRGNPIGQAVRYRRCPVCSELMARRNFGRSSGVIVDQCHLHGTWFDAGELPLVLEFVESGGLARQRQRELDELASKRTSAAFRASALPIRDVELEREADHLRAAGALVMNLLEAIFRAIR